MKFPARMRQLRTESDITIAEFADKLGVARTTVSNWENGNRKPDFDTLTKISKILSSTTDYLLGVSDIRNPNQINEPINYKEESTDLNKISKYAQDLTESDQATVLSVIEAIRRTKSKNDKHNEENEI